jgi:hypothetical protein
MPEFLLRSMLAGAIRAFPIKLKVPNPGSHMKKRDAERSLLSALSCRVFQKQPNPLAIVMLLCMILCFAIQPARAGEFEGVYRIGKTRFTVKPVKMAYQVRWAKGHGSMFFFFSRETPDGKYLFVSEDGKKAKDNFLFDDSLFLSGTFIRSDGKQFPVRKAVK